MKRIIALTVASLALTLGASQAQAATWPANCHSWKCVNAHLNNLDQRAKEQRRASGPAETRAAWVLRCLTWGAVGVGQFPDYAGLTALDVSTAPQFWALAVNPACMTQPPGPAAHQSFRVMRFGFVR